MNLLIDAWIPVVQQGKPQLIRLQDILCHDEDFLLALPRDDMELACLQLIICLTQVVFPPEDEKALKQRIIKKLREEEYKQGIAPFVDWFDLNHPEMPFMQIRGVKAEKSTPIQKLFAGLPEGNNHAFFNDAGELQAVSPSDAVIALFNQAMNSPSFGGGFKGGFRGGAPTSTLISGDTLRQSIWFNVLYENTIRVIIPHYDALKNQDKPVWVEPIQAKSKISASRIALLRGLFWQPAHIELVWENQSVIGFKKERFIYDVIGTWMHPHSPRFWNLKKGEKEEKYLSFTTTAPAWTQLSRFVVEAESEKEGQQPAAVVTQFRGMSRGAAIHLLVGGYRNKQASILQRRHELLSLPSGWEGHLSELKQVIDQAIEIKKALRNKLYGFAKASGAGGVYDQAELLFYHNSEAFIHACLHPMDWEEAARMRRELQDKLIHLSWEIFEEVIEPYRHEPKMIKALAISRKTLKKAFFKLRPT